MRFMTYNIQIGIAIATNPTWNPDKVNLAGVADVIAAQNADVVVLQEVDRNRARSGNVDQARWLGERLGYNHAFAPAYTNEEEGHRTGAYGNAILSRFPIIDLQVTHLEHRSAKTGWIEPRSCFVATLDTDPAIQVMGLHLSTIAEERVYPLKQIAGIVKERSAHPLVMMGDFNANYTELQATELPSLLENIYASNPVATYPNGVAAHSAIDHMWVSAQWQVQAAWVVSERLGRSDHNPIVADLTL